MPEIESLINQYPTFRLLKDGLLCPSAFNSKQVTSRLNQNLNLKSDSVVTQGLDWIKIRCLSCRIVAKTDTHQRREEHRKQYCARTTGCYHPIQFAGRNPDQGRKVTCDIKRASRLAS